MSDPSANPYEPPSAPLGVGDEATRYGRQRLVVATIVVAVAELLHLVLASIAVGSIYPTAAFRLVVISALGAYTIRSRSNTARWWMVVLCTVWAIGYAYQAVSSGGFDGLLVAGVLLLGVALLVSRPVSAYLPKKK